MGVTIFWLGVATVLAIMVVLTVVQRGRRRRLVEALVTTPGSADAVHASEVDLAKKVGPMQRQYTQGP